MGIAELKKQQDYVKKVSPHISDIQSLYKKFNENQEKIRIGVKSAVDIDFDGFTVIGTSMSIEMGYYQYQDELSRKISIKQGYPLYVYSYNRFGLDNCIVTDKPFVPVALGYRNKQKIFIKIWKSESDNESIINSILLMLDSKSPMSDTVNHGTYSEVVKPYLLNINDTYISLEDVKGKTNELIENYSLSELFKKYSKKTWFLVVIVFTVLYALGYLVDIIIKKL